MNLTISGHHIDVTPSLREYLLDKLERIKRHFDNVIGVEAILSIDNLRHKAEVILSVAGQKLVAHSIHDDMYAAIDLMMDKLDRQVRKYKEMQRGHNGANIRKGGEHLGQPVESSTISE